MNACRINGCGKPVQRGFICTMHTARKSRTGSYEKTNTPTRGLSPQDVFHHHNNPNSMPEDGSCWIWQGGLNKSGYGFFQKKSNGVRKIYMAHRMSYEIHKGPIGDGNLVCHTCDNPPCVNPAHLFAGSPQDNSDDMMSKGRHNTLYGEDIPRAALKNTDVIEILWLLAAGVGQRKISRIYNITHIPVHHIKNGTGWSWLTGIKEKQK